MLKIKIMIICSLSILTFASSCSKEQKSQDQGKQEIQTEDVVSKNEHVQSNTKEITAKKVNEVRQSNYKFVAECLTGNISEDRSCLGYHEGFIKAMKKYGRYRKSLSESEKKSFDDEIKPLNKERMRYVIKVEMIRNQYRVEGNTEMAKKIDAMLRVEEYLYPGQTTEPVKKKSD